MQKALKVPSWRRYQEGLLVLCTIGIVGAFYFYNLDSWSINDDEGSFLYQAWRISEGERPYADFFTSRWPLFLYTGGVLIRLFGRSIWAMRVVCVLLTLASAFLVFLLARRFLPAEGAWLALIIFLLHPQIFFHGRLFFPENFMIFFDILGLYLFDLGWNARCGRVLAISSLCFGIATFYKPIGLLPFAGCLLWSLVDTWRRRTNWRLLLVQATVFLLCFGLLVGLSFLGTVCWEPAFYSSFVGANLPQEQRPEWEQGVVNCASFLIGYIFKHFPLMIFVLPAAWANGQRNKRGALIAWQLPTALAFSILSRDLFLRHLFYLIPSFAILFALALEPLRQWAGRTFLLVAVICAVLLPWTIENALLTMRTESDTDRLAKIVRSQVDEGACLLSDYQELNFHAARQSTYLGAEISQVVIENGKITGERLIEEIEEYQVQMVIVDVSVETTPHFAVLADYERFHSYIQEEFELLGQFPRSKQLLEVYVRE